METDEGASKRRRKIVQKPREEEGDDLKRTFLIDPEVDIRLTILAGKRKTSRSRLVNELLKRETRGIVIQFRSGIPGEEEAAA